MISGLGRQPELAPGHRVEDTVGQAAERDGRAGPAAPAGLALLLDAVVRGLSAIGTGPGDDGIDAGIDDCIDDGRAGAAAAPPAWLAEEIATRYPHFAQVLDRRWDDPHVELRHAVATVLDASALRG